MQISLSESWFFKGLQIGLQNSNFRNWLNWSFSYNYLYQFVQLLSICNLKTKCSWQSKHCGFKTLYQKSNLGEEFNLLMQNHKTLIDCIKCTAISTLSVFRNYFQYANMFRRFLCTIYCLITSIQALDLSSHDSLLTCRQT